MKGWMSAPNDGDDDPYADEMKNPDSLVYRRRQAIDDVVKLMGCHCPRNVNCDHIDAISRVGAAMFDSAVDALLRQIRTLPRPLNMRQIIAAAEELRLLTMISTSAERR